MSTSPYDEAAILRRRVDALEASIAAMARRCDEPATARVVRVQAAPGTPNAMVGVRAVDVDCEEVEGGAVSLPQAGSTSPALNVGAGIPPADTFVVADLVGGYWTFQYDCAAEAGGA